MGTVSSDRLIPAEWKLENHGAPGKFGLSSRDPGQPIFIEVQGSAGGEIIEIEHVGDSCSFDLLNVDFVRVYAATYPTRALIEYTNLPIEIQAAPYATLSGSGLIGHFDLTVAAAATTAIWTPSTGSRIVVNSLFVSSDTQMRVAVVDNADSAGHRLLVAPAIPAGGSLARFFGDPDGFVSSAVGNVIKLVTSGTGTVFVALDGYERVG